MMVKVIFHLRKMTIYKDINTTIKATYLMVLRLLRKEAFKDLKNSVFSINQVWDDLISKNLIKGYKFNKNVLHLGTTAALRKYEKL